MTTAKQKFLENIKIKIKNFEAAYETMRALPDDIFEGNNAPSVGGGVSEKMDDDDFPITNTGILRKIIKQAGNKGISKGEMVRRFPKSGKSDDAHYQTITNTLTLLKGQGEVEGFKPTDVIMKGMLWRIKE